MGTPFNDYPVIITIPQLNLNEITYIRYCWYYINDENERINSDYNALVYPAINN